MTPGQESPPLGYQVTILRGVWERIKTFGAPRLWSHAWAACCLFVGLLLLTYWGIRWVALPVGVWLLGHGTLIWLTAWNERWDEMILAQWSRKYKSRYDAG
jgi:type IV secretory pathway TrbD component